MEFDGIKIKKIKILPSFFMDNFHATKVSCKFLVKEGLCFGLS